jgi:hypothetical protein
MTSQVYADFLPPQKVDIIKISHKLGKIQRSIESIARNGSIPIMNKYTYSRVIRTKYENIRLDKNNIRRALKDIENLFPTENKSNPNFCHYQKYIKNEVSVILQGVNQMNDLRDYFLRDCNHLTCDTYKEKGKEFDERYEYVFDRAHLQSTVWEIKDYVDRLSTLSTGRSDTPCENEG